jgi:hypothetical protein
MTCLPFEWRRRPPEDAVTGRKRGTDTGQPMREESDLAPAFRFPKQRKDDRNAEGRVLQ